MTVPGPLGKCTISAFGASACTVTIAAINPRTAIATAVLRVFFIDSPFRQSLRLRRRWRSAGRRAELHRLGCALDLYRCSVGDHFGDALHDFRRVVSRADHSVCAALDGMVDHQIES